MPPIDPALGLLAGTIIAKYPYLAWAIQNPELFAVLANSIQNQWSPQQTQAALQQTNYWKTTTDAQRGFDYMMGMTPAEAQRRVYLQEQLLQRNAAQLGLQIDPTQLNNFALQSLRDGLTPIESETHLLGMSAINQGYPPGQIGNVMTQVRNVGADYGMTIGSQVAMGYATDILEGKQTLDTITQGIRNQAAALYPQLQPQIQSGMTVKQWADPYISLASQELGITPTSISMADPKWQKMLSFNDPSVKGGQVRPMTLVEWQKTLRTDPTYGFDSSPVARQQATDFGARLLQSFGQVGGGVAGVGATA